MKKPSGLLGVKIEADKKICTPWSGASLLIDLNRKLELDQLANKILPAKKTSNGFKPGGNGRKLHFTQCPGRRMF